MNTLPIKIEISDKDSRWKVCVVEFQKPDLMGVVDVIVNKDKDSRKRLSREDVDAIADWFNAARWPRNNP